METLLIEKVSTGVKGLDDMLGGGLPVGRSILVCGGPGSGKTIFGIQFLYNGAMEYGEPGLYVSLDESPTHLKQDVASFGWDIEGLERQKKLAIVDASPIRAIPGQVKIGNLNIGKRDFSMLSLIEIIKTRVQEFGVKRLVIDPITTFAVQYPNSYERRSAVLDLIQAVTNLGTTNLMISELRATALERQIQAEEFLSHGVVVFHTISKDGEIVRAVQIEKMRGISHDHQLRPYKIYQTGMEVFSKENIFSRTKIR